MTADLLTLADAARVSAAWPFEEARKIIQRIERTGQKSVLFETGYGPSGLPHIGTFGEVARTTMVRHAFTVLTEGKIETRLLAFSDDMDGLRKVPDNVPNREMMAQYLGKPLTRVPDPFSNEYPSFGAANNARLRAFLDRFGFDYEFASSTDYYTSGRFDEMLLRMLEVYDKVMDIILPTLGPDRRATYSPFLPICPRTGIVLQVPMIERDASKGTIVYVDPGTGQKIETTVTGGAVKCQWKADWALRWAALGVDYEMAGKDLIDSVKLSGNIVRVLGGTPPEGFNYELFLDEKGQKISKSKGNGLTIEQWLTYASPESLSLFMFQKPREAKRLYFDAIPRAVDEYLQFLNGYERQDWKNRLGNPVWHIHAGQPPAPEVLQQPGQAGGTVISFVMLLNLAAVANSEDPQVLWGFLRRYAPGVSRETHPRLDLLVGYAVSYFRDFVRPAKSYRVPDDVERGALESLDAELAKLPPDASAEDIQTILYDVARPIPRFQDMKAKGATAERPGVSNDWFNMLYQVLLGESRGPRFGSFVALYGIPETRALIAKALSGALVREHEEFLQNRAA
ncbi:MULTISPECIES: lysine--tRNA ligase [unclassified Beijerinckia]|uniref:lysine--tRNA ligase n=1 Tax=unclassified Beijerinckia TaxID=2638183 RepID=UPI00089629B4|nr:MULTISPECIES: lysine--tRNA ligase [unclassified Beijerinckia]MDH7796662.1 lysyl-tRNA synthetase class 1 [Beijerinckia sp. GAS462]SEC54656.1 lysyl-tRNA synthetase, class I [Beijerinckia sp. 28-YEA-48]